ncbi:hypothetical protein AAFF_G00067130 [Aldrovandia affinis]|uniref:ZP domain-containing protein n=1 Tax=Aldrovandia affinis TaxID=143900 RepID=A0AAD7T4L1_9TELE|nr:hypothetical protein AAFF_G00067130 [Aldrovandia affinis]
MHIEASVVQANHVPLHVFVDRCVATLDPNMDAVPSYTFIENHGCLTDAKLTGSPSAFLPRVQDDKLHLQLDAFRFSQETHSSLPSWKVLLSWAPCMSSRPLPMAWFLSPSSLLKAEAHRAAVVILAAVVAAVGLVCATLLRAVLLRRPLKPMSCN